LELEMTDPEALVVAAYVFADEYPVAVRAGRPGALAVQASSGYRGP
jgi:hypothetical protein